MDRRTFTARFGVCVAALGLAGCTSDGTGKGDEGTPTESETETTTEGTESPSPNDPSLADASLTMVDAGCGQQTDEAAVAFEADAGEVVVTGTIWGANACKVPRLADASYHADADELVVFVATENKEEVQGCAQCITELDYEVTCVFDGALPGSVTVRHGHGDDPATVSTASRS